LQKVVPGGQRHAPETQSWAAPHARSQLPQLFGSVCRSAHAFVQAASPFAHAQTPFVQLAAGGQTFPQRPQFCCELLRLTQALPHALVPAGQPQ